MSTQFVCDRCHCVNTKGDDVVSINIKKIHPTEYEEKYDSIRSMDLCKAKCFKELHQFLDSVPKS